MSREDKDPTNVASVVAAASYVLAVMFMAVMLVTASIINSHVPLVVGLVVGLADIIITMIVMTTIGRYRW